MPKPEAWAPQDRAVIANPPFARPCSALTPISKTSGFELLLRLEHREEGGGPGAGVKRRQRVQHGAVAHRHRGAAGHLKVRVKRALGVAQQRELKALLAVEACVELRRVLGAAEDGKAFRGEGLPELVERVALRGSAPGASLTTKNGSLNIYKCSAMEFKTCVCRRVCADTIEPWSTNASLGHSVSALFH